uniref:Uncharacterized protein n=1 Tax=Babesia bovis TaxID=5865 RepID=S6BKV2_BABBO|nr:hypothetical protein [Babesia bovis]
MIGTSKEIDAIRQQYEPLLKNWIEDQTIVDRCLTALASILETYILFSGLKNENVDLSSVSVDRILEGYSVVNTERQCESILYGQAMDMIYRIKRTKQIERGNASPLIANLTANLPGAITLFLHHKSNSATKILHEMKQACEKHAKQTLPKMEKLMSMAALHTATDSKCSDADNKIAEAIQQSFVTVEKDINTILELIASVTLDPYEKEENIHAYLQQINSCNIQNVRSLWHIIKYGPTI